MTEPRDILVKQLHGTETKINSEEVRIESRNGKGQPMVTVILDDVVTSAE